MVAYDVGERFLVLHVELPPSERVLPLIGFVNVLIEVLKVVSDLNQLSVIHILAELCQRRVILLDGVLPRGRRSQADDLGLTLLIVRGSLSDELVYLIVCEERCRAG